VAFSADGLAFVAGISSIEVFKSSQKIHEVKPPFTPSSIAVGGNLVAVGGEDNVVHLYSWQGQSLEKAGQLEGNKGVVSALAFSPDSSLVASGDVSARYTLHGHR
jgi:WD repeat-containing protein 1 (actin-interacting protein 1)